MGHNFAMWKGMTLFALSIFLGGLVGCGDTTKSAHQEPVASVAGDSLVIADGSDTVWVWWAKGDQLAQIGGQQAIGAFPTVGMDGDSLVLYFLNSGAWDRIGILPLTKNRMPFLQVGISPSGAYDFALELYRSGVMSLRVAGSTEFPMLRQVPITAPQAVAIGVLP
jgi:hypothetical protein